MCVRERDKESGRGRGREVAKEGVDIRLHL